MTSRHHLSPAEHTKAIAGTHGNLEAAFQAMSQTGRWKKVRDENSGQIVGSIRMIGTGWEYRTPSKDGFALTQAEALAEMEAAILQARADDAAWAARKSEVLALPEPLRTLRIELDAAAINLEIERQRHVPRPDDIKLAEQRLTDATMAFDAFERGLAEAA
jgi:hypothetical protein